MVISPLLNDSISLTSADVIVTEGSIDGAQPGEQMLIAPFHAHDHDDEVFYILEGSVAFSLAGEDLIATVGDAVLVPAGVIHSWWNASDVPARYMIIMPTRINDLIVAIHRDMPDEAGMRELYRRFDATYIGWSL